KAMAVAAVIEARGLAGLDVDALDPAARIAFVGAGARAVEARDLLEEESAIVAVVVVAVGTDRDPVRAAAGLGHDLDLAVLLDVGNRLALDLDDDDRAVLLRDRAFGKQQGGRHDVKVGHRNSPS